MNKIIRVKKKPCGPYQTNCYIVCYKDKEIIIDPGVGALEWIKKEVKNPKAILNTHAHFDHVWDNQITKEHFDIPLACPKDDLFLMQELSSKNNNVPKSYPDIIINKDKTIFIDEEKIQYIHLAGHTPGTSIIVIQNYIFSGDFVFADSIGRVDFPYSNPNDMKKSIKKFMSLKLDDKKIFTGHGENTSLHKEQKNIKKWLNYI